MSWSRRTENWPAKIVWPIWDEVTVAYVLGMAEVDEHPRPKLKGDLTFDHTSTRSSGTTILWVRSVNTEAVWDDLVESILRTKS